MVGQQPLGYVRNQNRVADIGVACADFFNRQVVGQMARADDLNAVVKDEDSDGCADKVVAVNQCVDQQFFKNGFGNFRLPGAFTPRPACVLCRLRMMKASASAKSLGRGPAKSSVSR